MEKSALKEKIAGLIAGKEVKFSKSITYMLQAPSPRHSKDAAIMVMPLLQFMQPSLMMML